MIQMAFGFKTQPVEKYNSGRESMNGVPWERMPAVTETSNPTLTRGKRRNAEEEPGQRAKRPKSNGTKMDHRCAS